MNCPFSGTFPAREPLYNVPAQSRASPSPFVALHVLLKGGLNVKHQRFSALCRKNVPDGNGASGRSHDGPHIFNRCFGIWQGVLVRKAQASRVSRPTQKTWPLFWPWPLVSSYSEDSCCTWCSRFKDASGQRMGAPLGKLHKEGIRELEKVG
jgi:hypothetical protein